MTQQWNQEAHKIWLSGQRSVAIQTLVDALNHSPAPKPKSLFLQFCYYLFLIEDYGSAVKVLDDALRQFPGDVDLQTNLVVCLSRAGEYGRAVLVGQSLVDADPNNYSVFDALAKCYSKLQRFDDAVNAGDSALMIKDQIAGAADETWCLPETSIAEWLGDKRNVIAFSLWGNAERYINGAIRNLILAHDIYPDWQIWIYHDSSIPSELCNTLAGLGAILVPQSGNASEKQKLCWRFKVANDPSVGYFLVRDIDSVFSVRERMAVEQWLASDKWFHTIHDWWTHTDLILAGLWGGIAGVLPDLWEGVNDYSPATLTTPNVDQWFLRDRVWPYLKQSCLAHKRFYQQSASLPIPGSPPIGKQHIGSCEFDQSPDIQRKLVAPWLASRQSASRS